MALTEAVLVQGHRGARAQRFNIDTKSFRDTALNDCPVPPSEFARMWLDSVSVYGMLERSILQSFDWRTLIAAKAMEPCVAIAVLTEDPTEAALLAHLGRPKAARS